MSSTLSLRYFEIFAPAYKIQLLAFMIIKEYNKMLS